MKRRRMNGKKARRVFKSGNKIKGRNRRGSPMRGGFRL